MKIEQGPWFAIPNKRMDGGEVAAIPTKTTMLINRFLSNRNNFWIYLLILSLGSILLAWNTTSPFGAGVGTDGAIQVSTAENLQAGQGFYDYSGAPFLRWPPLYPLVLAGLSVAARLDPFVAGWALNVLLFGVIVWLGGRLLYQAFPDEPLWAFLGAAVLAASFSLLAIAVNIGNDPLYMALALGFLLAAHRYVATGARSSLYAMGVLAALAAFQRLPGIVLVITGAILIIYVNRKNTLKGIPEGLLFFALTALPMGLWIVIHNFAQHNDLFGVFVFNSTVPLFNLQNSLVKIAHWFIPYGIAEWAPIPMLILVAALGVIAWRRPAWALRLVERLRRPTLWPSLLFSLLYLVFLVFTINSEDTGYPYYDRYQVVILPPVLILLFAILQDLLVYRIRWANVWRLAALAIFAAWLVYPIHTITKYVQVSRSDGIVTYNKYNTRALRDSQVIRLAQDLGKENGPALYSNYPGAVWFYTRRTVYPSPRGPVTESLNINRILREYKGWPGNRPGYLIWFLPNEYDHVMAPVDLMTRLADLRVVYRGTDGEVYRVRPR